MLYLDRNQYLLHLIGKVISASIKSERDWNCSAMDGSQIGNTISLLRKNKGMTQAELAEKCDVTQPIIARWEKNQVQPRAKALEKLAVALGVSITEFMSGDYTRIAVHLNEVHDPGTS